MLLNNAPVAIAAAGRTPPTRIAKSTSRCFPSELFSQLTVAKTPSADLIEGGAAGTINMRMARPFDREGGRLAYSVQGVDNIEGRRHGSARLAGGEQYLG